MIKLLQEITNNDNSDLRFSKYLEALEIENDRWARVHDEIWVKNGFDENPPDDLREWQKILKPYLIQHNKNFMNIQKKYGYND